MKPLSSTAFTDLVTCLFVQMQLYTTDETTLDQIIILPTMKTSFFQLALAALLPTMIAASSSRQRCFVEPFPGMLDAEIQNFSACGLKNPHVIDYVCEPVRSLVLDATWLDFQLQQFEAESNIEDEHTYIESQVAFPSPSQPATLSSQKSFERLQNAGFLAQAAALAIAFGSPTKF